LKGIGFIFLGFIMKKFMKILATIFGITVATGLIYKERETIADLQKRLFEIRHFTEKK
jgi:hypothetical protein